MIYIFEQLAPNPHRILSASTLGQAPATEASLQKGFTHTEQILIASVVLSAVGIVIRLWEINNGK